MSDEITTHNMIGLVENQISCIMVEIFKVLRDGNAMNRRSRGQTARRERTPRGDGLQKYRRAPCYEPVLKGFAPKMLR